MSRSGSNPLDDFDDIDPQPAPRATGPAPRRPVRPRGSPNRPVHVAGNVTLNMPPAPPPPAPRAQRRLVVQGARAIAVILGLIFVLIALMFANDLRKQRAAAKMATTQPAATQPIVPMTKEQAEIEEMRAQTARLNKATDDDPDLAWIMTAGAKTGEKPKLYVKSDTDKNGRRYISTMSGSELGFFMENDELVTAPGGRIRAREILPSLPPKSGMFVGYWKHRSFEEKKENSRETITVATNIPGGENLYQWTEKWRVNPTWKPRELVSNEVIETITIGVFKFFGLPGLPRYEWEYEAEDTDFKTGNPIPGTKVWRPAGIGYITVSPCPRASRIKDNPLADPAKVLAAISDKK